MHGHGLLAEYGGFPQLRGPQYIPRHPKKVPIFFGKPLYHRKSPGLGLMRNSCKIFRAIRESVSCIVWALLWLFRDLPCW